jgi:S1-C subfamily serine protease
MLVASPLAGPHRRGWLAPVLRRTGVMLGLIGLAAALDVALSVAAAGSAGATPSAGARSSLGVPPSRVDAPTPGPSAPAVTPQQRAAAIVSPAVVLLEVHWEGWVRDGNTGVRWDERILTLTTRCSGFAVSNDGYVVTTGRCVDAGQTGVAPVFYQELVQRKVDEGILPADQAPAVVQDLLANGVLEGPRAGDPLNRRVYLQRGPATLGATTGEATEARVVTLHPPGSGDVALLKVERTNQPMLRLGEPGAVEAGSPVLVLGYPAAERAAGETIDLAVEEGTVTPAPTPSPTGEQDDEPATRLLLAGVEASAGLEGAPVVTLEGDVVGILTIDARSTDGPVATTPGPTLPGPAASGATAPGTAVPGTVVIADPGVLSEDLSANEVDNQLGNIDNDYRDGLDAYFEARYDDCIRYFDDVLAALPSHVQAQSFRQEAVARREIERESTPDRPDNRMTMIVGGGAMAALIAILAVAGMVLWRRRIAPTPPAPVDARDAARDRVANAGIRYCTNCSSGWPPGTTTCEKCGNPLE